MGRVILGVGITLWMVARAMAISVTYGGEIDDPTVLSPTDQWNLVYTVDTILGFSEWGVRTDGPEAYTTVYSQPQGWSGVYAKDLNDLIEKSGKTEWSTQIQNLLAGGPAIVWWGPTITDAATFEWRFGPITAGSVISGYAWAGNAAEVEPDSGTTYSITPEPSASLLLLAGLACIGLMCGRYKLRSKNIIPSRLKEVQ